MKILDKLYLFYMEKIRIPYMRYKVKKKIYQIKKIEFLLDPVQQAEFVLLQEGVYK